jgi:transcriptional regulator with GAF, ATPase, and Fis domain
MSADRITQMEKERAMLLSFSHHLATVRDLNGLRCIIKQFLKQLFQVRAYIITLRNPDNKTYSYFLHDLPGEDPTDLGFQIVTGTKMPIGGSLTGAVLRSEDFLIFDIREIVRCKRYSFPAASFWKAAGADRILGMRLRVGHEDVGILWLQAGQTNERLLSGISAQLAIALANALANKEIERQCRELEQYKRNGIGKAAQAQDGMARADQLQRGTDIAGPADLRIVGDGPQMNAVFHTISQVAFARTTVLILGETGTGKELVARAIHTASPRHKGPLVRVNCAALPPNLIESELFGHEKGAFTGAVDRKVGRFELANDGTLFLDEVGEMPPDLQVRLLRAIQEREIERLGGEGTIKVNVRIVAATNRDLQAEVLAGRFRSDLYYRLNVFPVRLPPLRERVEDIPCLVRHFIKKLAAGTGKSVTNITPLALRQLMDHKWPGNVRELENVVERALLMATGPVIEHVFLPNAAEPNTPNGKSDPTARTMEDNERDHIVAVLRKCKGKVSGPGGTASYLGIPPSTLNSKMRKLGIQKQQALGNLH